MIYAVLLAFHKSNIFFDQIPNYNEIPDYPKDFMIVRAYHNKQDQLDCYSETFCPASQLIEAQNTKELQDKVEQMKDNFQNKEWLSRNIDPFI